MQITIQSPHIKLSDKHEIFLITKLEHLGKIFNRIESCHVLIKKEKRNETDSLTIEAKLAIPGKDLFAKEWSESFELAIDKICADLEGQLRKKKEKLNDLNRKAKAVNIEESEL
jgi:putative sigma-54 modulation protein